MAAILKIVPALLNAFLTTPAADDAGRMVKKRISKTKAAVNTGTAAGVFVLLPMALQGDATSIGALVLIVISWGVALWGRARAD